MINLAWGRSGDKGNKANVGIIARKQDYFPYVVAAVTEEAVRQRFNHFIEPDSNVSRFQLPGLNALNFLLDEALGGGGMASIRNDAQGKGFAQLLLAMPVKVPSEVEAECSNNSNQSDEVS